MSSKRGMTASPSEIEWLCPYCDHTEPTLREAQTHITESVDGDHEGVSGESPDEDMVAIDPETGDEIDRYEGTDVVRPGNKPVEDASKRKQVFAAWLASGREEHPDLLSAVTDANREYAQQILGQIRRGEIGQDYWTDIDPELRQALEDRLDDYEPEIEEDLDMSIQEEANTDADTDGVSSKDIILNVYDLAGEDITRKPAWKALNEAGVFDAGYEYFRRTYKEAIDGEHDVSRAVDEQLQSVIEPILNQAGVISDSPESAAEEREQQREKDPSSGAAASSASATSDTSRGPGSSGVSVDELEALRDKVDTLRRQAEFEAEGEDSPEFRKAKFIAEETLSGIDELIEQAE